MAFVMRELLISEEIGGKWCVRVKKKKKKGLGCQRSRGRVLCVAAPLSQAEDATSQRTCCSQRQHREARETVVFACEVAGWNNGCNELAWSSQVSQFEEAISNVC